MPAPKHPESDHRVEDGRKSVPLDVAADAAARRELDSQARWNDPNVFYGLDPPFHRSALARRDAHAASASDRIAAIRASGKV
jgi:hypothetical protein